MKKIPERTCIACREIKPKNELIRIVRGVDGTVSIDFTGKASGRGAYICDDEACIRKCVKQKALNKVFKTEVDAEVYDNLLEEYVAKKQG